MTAKPVRIAVLGLGEAGGAIARDLAAAGAGSPPRRGIAAAARDLLIALRDQEAPS